MPNIPQVTIGGTTYNLKDSALREEFDTAQNTNILGIPTLATLKSKRIKKDGTVVNDILESLQYMSDVNMSSSTFLASSLNDYMEHLVSSTGTKLYEPVVVRNVTTVGQIADIYYDLGTYSGTANIAFGYKKDGTHDRTYKVTDINNGKLVLDITTYYLVFVQYTLVSITALYAETGRIMDDYLPMIPSLADLSVMTIDKNGVLNRDLMLSLKYMSGKSIESAVVQSTMVTNYMDYATSSEYAAKMFEPVRVRNENGDQIAQIHYDLSYSGNASIAYGYKHDGTFHKLYKITDVSNGVLTVHESTYYLIFVEYSSITSNLHIMVPYGSIIGENNYGMIMTLDDSVECISDLEIYAEFYNGKTIATSEFYNNTTLFDYEGHLTDSDTAEVSRPIRVRGNDGQQLSTIYCEYDENIGSAAIVLGYDKYGNPIGSYNATKVEDGVLILSDSVYYILVKRYSNAWISLKSKFVYDGTVRHYEVGEGKQFEKFTDCIRALKWDRREKVIDVYGGTYDIFDEIGGLDFIATIPSGALWYDVSDVVPDNTTIIGHGIVEFTMHIPDTVSPEKSILLSPINIRGSAKIKNLRINVSNCRYCIHPEGSKKPQFNNARYEFEDLYLVHADSAPIACGLNNGVYFSLKNCILKGGGNGAFSIHDQGIEYSQSPTVVAEGCVFVANYYAIVMASTKRTGMQTVIDVRIINCVANNLYMRKTSNSSADDTKDCFRAIYINTPHRNNISAQLIDVIPDEEYPIPTE